jgi:predicted nucleotidyltransferase
MKLNAEQKQKIIEICKRNDISYCGVFGSFARGEATEESDIDLLVKFSKTKGLFDFYGIEEELKKTLKRDIDLATEPMISNRIKANVFKDLQPIYEETR